MKKSILITAIAFNLYACTQVNSNSEKTVTQGEDTISNVDISLSKLDAVEALSEIEDEEPGKIIFKASGSEPGWIAEFYQTKIRVLLNYGSDSVLINGHFDSLDSDKGFRYATSVVTGKTTQTIAIAIENTPCTDDAGITSPRTVTISYNKEEYKGCGNFVK